MSEPTSETAPAPIAETTAEPKPQKQETTPVEPDDAVEQSAESTTFPDIAAMKYEDAREELVSIVARLEAGQAPLEDSMRLWRRGEALATHCARWLDGAQAEIEAAVTT